MSEKPVEPNEDREYEFKINCGSCLIINIDETQKEIRKGCFVKKLRTGAGKEVDRLQGWFSGEYFGQHYVIREKDVVNLDAEINKYIEKYIEDPGNKD